MVTLSPGAVAPQESSTVSHWNHEIQENCRTVLRRLNWPSAGPVGTLRTIAVTSCYGGEGVTTVAGELGAAAAHSNRRILLVDANLNRPNLHHTYSLDRSPGLAEVVLHGNELSDCIRTSGVKNLFILAAGDAAGKSARVYDSGVVNTIINVVREEFDLIVFDLPAVSEESSTIRLAGLIDGVLLVVESERVRREVAQRVAEQLSQADALLLGAILNKRQQHVPDWLYRTL